MDLGESDNVAKPRYLIGITVGTTVLYYFGHLIAFLQAMSATFASVDREQSEEVLVFQGCSRMNPIGLRHSS